jgi:hypothetical protein
MRFFPVSAAELLKIREDFPLGRYKLRIEETSFSLRDYNRSSPTTPSPSPPSRRSSRPRSTPSANAGAKAARPTTPAT